jgi:hypothetical protein
VKEGVSLEENGEATINANAAAAPPK